MKTLDYNLAIIMNEEFDDLWVNNISILAKLCLKWPGYESFSDRLESIKRPIFKKLKEIYGVHESTLYNVLNHGDCHYKNFMYKLVDGKTEDIMLVKCNSLSKQTNCD